MGSAFLYLVLVNTAGKIICVGSAGTAYFSKCKIVGTMEVGVAVPGVGIEPITSSRTEICNEQTNRDLHCNKQLGNR